MNTPYFALLFNKFPGGSTLDFKSVAMAEGCMPPPHALRRPRVRSRAHLRATMRTAVACSTCAWACAHLSLVATSAATWAVARADAWRNQNLRSNSPEGGTDSPSSVPAVGRCGATEIQV